MCENKNEHSQMVSWIFPEPDSCLSCPVLLCGKCHPDMGKCLLRNVDVLRGAHLYSRYEKKILGEQQMADEALKHITQKIASALLEHREMIKAQSSEDLDTQTTKYAVNMIATSYQPRKLEAQE